MEAFVLLTPPNLQRRTQGLPHATFVGASAPGTPVVEVAAVRDAAHFSTQAAALAYLAARTTEKSFSVVRVTRPQGVALTA